MSIFDRFRNKTDKSPSNVVQKDLKLSNAEIVFLKYLDGHATDGRFPNYWENYNINPKKVAETLYKNGYLIYADIEKRLEHYKATELKDYLKSKGLKPTGKKDQLIETILSNCDKDEIGAFFNKDFYQLTDKSSPFMEQAEFLSFFNYESINEAANIKRKNPDWDKFEIALLLAERSLQANYNNKNWGLYRNSLLHVSYIYEAAENYLEQLKYLCMVCYYDLSGLENSDSVMEKSSLILAPGVMGRIGKAQENLQYSKKQLKELYLEVASSLRLSHHYYTPESSWNRINREL